jgi:hypothetical protein
MVSFAGVALTVASEGKQAINEPGMVKPESVQRQADMPILFPHVPVRFSPDTGDTSGRLSLYVHLVAVQCCADLDVLLNPIDSYPCGFYNLAIPLAHLPHTSKEAQKGAVRC